MADLTKSVKTPVVLRQDYVMYLEFFNGYLWFHTDILRWTSKVKREFIKDLNTVQSLLPAPLVALVTEDNEKLAKFGDSVGWIRGQQIMLNNGSTAYIYSWSK
jgi:hypothetical protein